MGVAGKGIKDQNRNIAINQELLLKFFASAGRKLNKNGEIHVTLRTGLPYSKWNTLGLAERTGRLRLKKTIEFDPLLYPGYAQRALLWCRPTSTSTSPSRTARPSSSGSSGR